MLSWIFGLLSIFSALAGLGFLWLAFRHGAAEDGSVSGDTIYFDPVDELDDVDEGLSDNIVSLQKQAAQQPQPDFLADINLDATLAEVPEIKPDIARPLTVKLDQALMTDKTLLIQVIENEGTSDSAEQAARQLVKLAPNRPEHRLTLLKILAERNKYEDFDDNLQALYALGNIDASRQAKRLVQKLAVRQEDTIVSDTIDDALAKELTLTASVATGTHKALADTLSQNSLATHDEETPTASASASKSWTSKMASISLDDLDLILDDKEVNAPPLFDKNEHVEAITPSIKEEMMTKTDLEFGLPTELNLKVELADDAPPPSKIDKNITEALMFDVAEPANKINSDELEFVMDKSDVIATEEFKIPKDKTIALSNPTLMDLNSIDFASPAADTTKELMQVKDTRTVEAIGANEIDGFFQTKPDNSPVVDVHSTTTIANSLLNELMADFPDLMSNNSAIEQISLAKQYVALGDSGAAIDMLKHVIETTNSSADKVAAEEALQEITG